MGKKNQKSGRNSGRSSPKAEAPAESASSAPAPSDAGAAASSPAPADASAPKPAEVVTSEGGKPTGPPRSGVTEHKHGGLGEFEATAICGNDITSSCLYVSALCIIQAGIYAPVCLLIVAALLFLFRKIYAEVVGALPLNGGAYNALLNTTSKQWASLAACLTLLSYMATAVISGLEAMHYLHNLWHGLPIIPATVVLLALFMVLTIIGIGESAKVAMGIFVFHLVTLTLLLIAGGIYLFGHGLDTFWMNYGWLPIEHVSAGGPVIEWQASDYVLQEGESTRSLVKAIFFGFCAAMLGISGFESSSNFVEEQAEGVFPKTLRNMWLAVGFFNPMMALLALSLVSVVAIQDPQIQNALLSHLGAVITGGGKGQGTWLSWIISTDAVLVLSGAVLTSYVGVTGLARRMTLDRCLPQWLLKTNSRGTSHRIICGFFLLSISVLLITSGWKDVAVVDHSGAPVVRVDARTGRLFAPFVDANGDGEADVNKDGQRIDAKGEVVALLTIAEEGARDAKGRAIADNGQPIYEYHTILKDDVTALAGVYTISFLCVMVLFGFGNVLLKVRRARLPRPERARWPAVIFAITAVILGIIGNYMMNPQYFLIFLCYFIPAMLIVTVMLNRIGILKVVLFMVHSASESVGLVMGSMQETIVGKIDEINDQQVVFFTRGDNIGNLNEALLYVRRNEHTRRIKVVTVVRTDDEVPSGLARDLDFLDKAYPEIDIEFVVVKGRFGPDLVTELESKWDIPANFMFIGSPGDHFLYGLAELGGVRLII